jgi:hypothetical protein
MSSSPSFGLQPGSVSKYVTDKVILSVDGTGSPTPTFQWYFNGTTVSNGTRISGAATKNLTIYPLATTDAGSYLAVATNGIPSDATSSAATLTVTNFPYGGIGHTARGVVSGQVYSGGLLGPVGQISDTISL